MTVVEKWTIWVNGYGCFDFDGTELEAEEMRAAKCRHEGGIGYKYRRENQRPSDIITEEISYIFESGTGVKQSLLTKRRRFIAQEAANKRSAPH